MTAAARNTLNDCYVALQMLEDEKDFQRWRIIWVSAVALLRTVGHVLDKIDGQHPDVKAASNAAYKNWMSDAPVHQIFRDFIDKERNLILKEYQFNLHPLESVPVAVQLKLASVGSTEANFVTAYVDAFPDNIFRPLLDSPWEGNDARDVYSEALKWWEKQLAYIDRKAQRIRRQQRC